MWFLFLDDLRNPDYCIVDPEVMEHTVVARSSSEAIELIEQLGMPGHIFFDHDLGGDDTAMRLVHWLVERDIDENILKPGFTFSVHSSNPVGANNIAGTLKHRIRFKNL